MANYQYEMLKTFLNAVELAEKTATTLNVPATELKKEIRTFKKWITFYKSFNSDDLLDGTTVKVGEDDEADVVTATLIERKEHLIKVLHDVMKADHEETQRILSAEVRLHQQHIAGEISDEDYQKALKKAVRDRKKLNI